ncbi:hypothetical protein GBAR_LOCUS29284 [Geodia barretti]|uniref:Uncharacterized protein n=1 Tax=Geodia barretti TaxID=519541 RepID=A0AA35TTA7_GEOBA|nr:hypothetical protein GBAR_LOCUS29284 [Geodia barretti]
MLEHYLYDLDNDIGESKNVSEHNVELTLAMKVELEEFLNKLARVTLAGIAVFFIVFTASLLPAVLVTPTVRYEEVSSFHSLLISNSSANFYSATFIRTSLLSLAFADYNRAQGISDVVKTRNTTAVTNASEIPPRHRVTHPKSRGFILATEYQQQLLGGFKGFYHLSKIASALNLSIVEPFVSRTSLTGVPSLKEGLDQCFKLSHFYDLYGLRDAFLQCSDVKLETFENFFTKSSHRIVMVDFLKSLDFYRKVFPPNGMNMKTIELKSDTKGTLVSLALLNQYAAHMFQKRCKKIRCSKTKYLFKKSRVILIDARPLHPLSWELVRTTLESVINEEVNKYGSVTLVLPSWRDIQPPGMISSFFYSMPDFPWDNCQDVVLIPHSKTVMAAADKFVADKMKPHPVVGVHIRAERLLIDYKGDVTHFMGCLKQLKNLLGNGTIPSVRKENVHLIHDLGTYGSQSCTDYCKLGYDRALWEISKLGYKVMNFKPWDQSHTLQNTLAAFVDREYLTRVDVLVTIGRGEFQQNIVERFLNRSEVKRDKLYRICNNGHPIPTYYPHC